MSKFDSPKREVGARISHSAAQSLVTATPTILSLNTTRRANGVTVGADKLTTLEAGWYVISAHVAFAANATGLRAVSLKLGGTTYIGASHAPAISGTSTCNLSVSAVYYLAVGEFIQIEAYQESGGALNVVSAGNYSPELAMMKLPGVP